MDHCHFLLSLFITGIFICGEAKRSWGKKTHLPLSGMNLWPFPIFFITIPEEISFQDGNSSLIWLLLGFILFRFFDIVKPLGINSLQKVKNGFGVMIDDF